MIAANRNELWGRVLVDELARSGVGHACVSPGSRSAPLALALDANPAIRAFVFPDERSSAFFALGLARATRRPVALLCTSGTAGANYLPAMVEASQSRVPLVVITADRPPEARDWGAPQTVDQVRLYGTYVRWFVDLPVPEPTPAGLAYLRQTACRAVAMALAAPRGPVHLNVPLREPLAPIEVAGDVPDDLPDALALGREGNVPFLEHGFARTEAPEAILVQLAGAIAAEERGVIAVGPCDLDPEARAALMDLARAAAYPILAEGASSLRFGAQDDDPVIAHADLIFRSERFVASHAPRLLLKLGEAATSRRVGQYLERAQRVALVDSTWRYADPGHRSEIVVQGDPAHALRRLAERVRASMRVRAGAWRQDFLRADRIAATAVADELGERTHALTELSATADFVAALPDPSALWVANSMPIRDLDVVAPRSPRRLRVLAHRGASGIDGTLSAAMGLAAGHAGSTALVSGDLAFLHDLGGLLAAKAHGVALTVLLVNNDGGGIFSFLDVGQTAPRGAFERLFGTPHGLDFRGAVEMFGGAFVRPADRAELRSAATRAFESRGLTVIEARTRRDENLAAHQKLWARAQRCLEDVTWP